METATVPSAPKITDQALGQAIWENRTMYRALVSLAAFLVLPIGSVRAEVLIYTFGVEVDYVNETGANVASVGDHAKITVYLDTESPPTVSGTYFTRYDLLQLDVSVGQFEQSYFPTGARFSLSSILIRNNDPFGVLHDNYRLEGVTWWGVGGIRNAFSFDLVDLSATVYGDQSLPNELPDLADFDLGSTKSPPFADFDFDLKIDCDVIQCNGTIRGYAVSVETLQTTIADAGEDQTVDEDDLVTLDGSQSTGDGNGRVYEVAFTADDGFESCDGVVQVSVPRRRKLDAVDDGQIFDSTQP